MKLLAILLACVVSCASALRAEVGLLGHERVELVFGDAAIPRIDRLFARFDPDYRRRHLLTETRLDTLARMMFDHTIAGGDTRCSQQIFVEAKWLVGYTAWWDWIDQRLDDLGKSLMVMDQSFADAPSEIDGFYGVCSVEEFVRIEQTLEHYFVLADRGETLPVDRIPLSWAQHPERFLAELRSWLISDVAFQGEDMRSRIGGFTSMIAATDRRDPVVELIRRTRRGSDAREGEMDTTRAVFNRFVDAWQDPETGYWGAWYRDGETVFKTTDLSITYHLVHARKGRVARWPQIIATTLALQDQTYPFGWLSDGHWTNHNNYDLARLFSYGWPHLADDQRAEVAEIMQRMVDWAFTETLDETYEGFKLQPELSSSVAAEFYFGVAFLDAVGFFEDEPFYGKLVRPAEPVQVCAALTAYEKRLDENDPYAVGGRRKLERVCAERIDPG